jgi:hypothetical protein
MSRWGRLPRPVGVGLAVLGVVSAAVVGAGGAAAAPGASSTATASGAERVVTLRDPRLTESSGLVLSPTHANLAWTVNDSGTGPVLYGVSTRTGATRALLRLRGIDFRDPEALTATTGADGRGFLWVADIGDNDRERDSVVLRLVREPRQPTSTTVTPVSLRLRYPGGPVDAETLLWTPDGRLLVVTKELVSAQVLQVPPPAVRAALAGKGTDEPVVALPLATVAQGMVTDGAALPDGRIVLRGYGDAVVYDAPGDGAMIGLEQLVLPSQPQGETLAVQGPDAVLVGSEGVRQPLWRVRVPGATAVASETSRPATATPSASTEPPPRVTAGTVRRTAWLLGAGGLLVVGVLTGVRRRGRRRR